MKKTLIALAALAATSAFAQSSLTISGAFNYGVSTSVAGVHGYGGWKGDRNFLNFGVVEDLGGGLKVSGNVQARWNMATSMANTGYVNTASGGTQDNLFEQSAFAIDSSFGQIRVGRFTNAVGVAPLHPFEDSAQSTAPHQAANGRFSGQIQYMSPTVGGFQVFALNAQKSANVYHSSSGAGYSNAWKLNVPNLATGLTDATRHANPNFVGINYRNGPVFAQYYTMTDLLGLKSSKLGASYDLGVAKLYASQFTQNSNIGFSATAGASAVGKKAHKATEVAVQVPMGAWMFSLGSYGANGDIELGKTDGSTKTSRTAWGATYNFSKRTQAIYVASSTSKGSAATAAGMPTGKNQWLGLQHNF